MARNFGEEFSPEKLSEEDKKIVKALEDYKRPKLLATATGPLLAWRCFFFLTFENFGLGLRRTTVAKVPW